MLRMPYTSALALLLMANAGSADGLYVRGFGGVATLTDTDVSIGAAGGPATFDTGSVFGGAVGYEYAESPWRAELEFAYRGADADSLPAAIGTAGDFASTAVMVNGLYEFGETGRWQPYVGAGLGVITEIDFDLDGVGEFNDRGGFAAQVMLGAEYALSDQLFLTGEIRYFDAGSVNLDNAGSTLDAGFSTTDINLGLRFSF